jgi:hypothetical protein
MFFISLLGLEEALERASRERIHIPFGVGICGYVAQTKETINLRNAYEVTLKFFGRVFNFNLGSFVLKPCNYILCKQPFLELKTWPIF